MKFQPDCRNLAFQKNWAGKQLLSVLPGAFGVALVAFAESVAIARAYGTKYGYEVDADQELIAIGVSNFGSGFSGAFIGRWQYVAYICGRRGRRKIADGFSGCRRRYFDNGRCPHRPILQSARSNPGRDCHPCRLEKYQLQQNSQIPYDYQPGLYYSDCGDAGVLALGLLEGLLVGSIFGLIVLLYGTKQRNTFDVGQRCQERTFTAAL